MFRIGPVCMICHGFDGCFVLICHGFNGIVPVYLWQVALRRIALFRYSAARLPQFVMGKSGWQRTDSHRKHRKRRTAQKEQNRRKARKRRKAQKGTFSRFFAKKIFSPIYINRWLSRSPWSGPDRLMPLCIVN